MKINIAVLDKDRQAPRDDVGEQRPLGDAEIGAVGLDVRRQHAGALGAVGEVETQDARRREPRGGDSVAHGAGGAPGGPPQLLNRTEKQDGNNHRKHGRRTARKDRRADDGVQEGPDRGRRRPEARRGDPAGQAGQQGEQGRLANHVRREVPVPVPLERLRRDPVGGERLGRGLYRALVVVQVELTRNRADRSVHGVLRASFFGYAPPPI